MLEIRRKKSFIKPPFIHPDGEFLASLTNIQETVLYNKNVIKFTFNTNKGQIAAHFEVNEGIICIFEDLAGIGGLDSDVDLNLSDLIGINVTLSINYSKITKIYKQRD